MIEASRDFSPQDGADDRSQLAGRVENLRLIMRGILGRWPVTDAHRGEAVDLAMTLLASGDERTQRIALDALVRMDAANSREAVELMKMATAAGDDRGAEDAASDAPPHLVDALLGISDRIDDES